MTNFTTKAMTGLSIMGSITTQNVMFLLAGDYDLEIKTAMYFTYMKKAPTSLADLEIEDVLVPLSRFKEIYRKQVQSIFKMAEAEMKKETLEKIKNSNKPHELGTVAEIAEKYKISKSEVRRRKADGTLNELTISA